MRLRYESKYKRDLFYSCRRMLLGQCRGVMGKYLFDVKRFDCHMACNSQTLEQGSQCSYFCINSKGNLFFVWKRKDSAISQMIFGIIGMAMCQMTFFLAIQESNPGTATVLQYSAPILIMVFFVLVEKYCQIKKKCLFWQAVIVGIFFTCNTWKYKNLVITNAALFWGIVIRFCICSL